MHSLCTHPTHVFHLHLDRMSGAKGDWITYKSPIISSFWYMLSIFIRSLIVLYNTSVIKTKIFVSSSSFLLHCSGFSSMPLNLRTVSLPALFLIGQTNVQNIFFICINKQISIECYIINCKLSSTIQFCKKSFFHLVEIILH